MADETLDKLKAPFPEEDIEWRVQQVGEKNGKPWAMVLAYIDNRAVIERLDEVFGVEGWQNKFEPLEGGGYLCGISCKFGDEWVTKWDGADKTDVEATKGGISSAMKRAGSQWGIGRYLYNLEVTFANICENGKYKGKVKINNKDFWFKWDAPNLPSWALPKSSQNAPDSTQKVKSKDIRDNSKEDKKSTDGQPDENKAPFDVKKYGKIIETIKDTETTKYLDDTYKLNRTFIDSLPKAEKKDLIKIFKDKKGELV